MKVECPRCHTHVDKPDGGDPVCPTCGFNGGDIAAPSQAAPATSSLTTQYGTQAEPKKGMALTAMILGIVGFLTGFLIIGMLLDVVAIVLGIVALVQIKDRPNDVGGKGMAITGLVVGAVGLLFMIILLASIGNLEEFLADTCNDLPPEDRPDDCDPYVDDSPAQQALGALTAIPMIGLAIALARR